jgi:hypothetical protein
MLAEILVFSLLAGAIVVFDTYQVFSKSRDGDSDEFRTRVVETTLFGTVPGVVGACVATPTLTESEAAYVLFVVFTSLFLLSLFVRYADLGRRSGVFWSGLTESTSVFLIGSISCVSIGTVPGTSSVGPCLLYVSLYYFWAADLGDESGGGDPYKPLLTTDPDRSDPDRSDRSDRSLGGSFELVPVAASSSDFRSGTPVFPEAAGFGVSPGGGRPSAPTGWS